MINVSTEADINGIKIKFSDSIEISNASTDEYIGDMKQSLLKNNLKSIQKIIEEMEK